MILIVDDFKTQRMFLEHLCKDLQIPSVSASTGAEALVHLEQHKIDLIVTDLEMPDMDGLEMVARVKKNPEWSDIRILMISSATALRKRALDLGVNTFMSKPYEKEDVRKAVMELLGQKRTIRMYRVLLIDDVMMQTAIWEKSLEMEQFEFVKAHSAAEALGILRSQPFDAIVTDYLMPAVDGARFVRKIKSMPEFQHLPVFVITSDLKATKETIGDVEEVFYKPFNAQEVKSALKNAVGWRV